MGFKMCRGRLTSIVLVARLLNNWWWCELRIKKQESEVSFEVPSVEVTK